MRNLTNSPYQQALLHGHRTPLETQIKRKNTLLNDPVILGYLVALAACVGLCGYSVCNHVQKSNLILNIKMNEQHIK